MESNSHEIDFQTLVENAGNGVAGAKEALDEYRTIKAIGGIPVIYSSQWGYRVVDKFSLKGPSL